jgi:hypothetical protein
MLGGLRTSFRGRLAIRFGLTVMAVAGVGSTVGYWVIRDLMFDQVDRTLLRLASLEASFAAAPQDTTVRFHHAVLLNAGSASQAILPRYGQVWSVEGKPIIRTSNLNGSDLPLDEDVRPPARTTSARGGSIHRSRSGSAPRLPHVTRLSCPARRCSQLPPRLVAGRLRNPAGDVDYRSGRGNRDDGRRAQDRGPSAHSRNGTTDFSARFHACADRCRVCGAA